jgi:hypothetical protein
MTDPMITPKLYRLLKEIVDVATIEPRDLTVDEQRWFDEAKETLTTFDPLAYLCGILNAFCDEHGLPYESADELAAGEEITDQQRQWLYKFIDEWDAVA